MFGGACLKYVRLILKRCGDNEKNKVRFKLLQEHFGSFPEWRCRKQLIPEQFVLLFILMVVFVFVGENVGIYVKKGGKKEEKKDLKVFYASDVYIMIIILITCGLFVCSFLSLHQFICWFLLPGQIYLIISLCSSTSSS